MPALIKVVMSNGWSTLPKAFVRSINRDTVLCPDRIMWVFKCVFSETATKIPGFGLINKTHFCLMHIHLFLISLFLREASSPCQKDTFSLNLSRSLLMILMILQRLQSPTLSIQELLQKITEQNAAQSPEKRPAPVEFKVRILTYVYRTADVCVRAHKWV